ncbi:MAG: methyltransferase domain-containing protein [Gammaproteobacteria bacterium]|nr:methyltransferase domain-containing protein [Gammaproteobacteria bacterium]
MEDRDESFMYSEYLFQNSSPFELARLQLLNNIYNPNSQHGLQAVLRPGMNVLELGCGPTILGRWIAEQIGEEGTYVGIERDGQQIMRAEQNSLGNMVFIESEIERINEIALPGYAVD